MHRFVIALTLGLLVGLNPALAQTSCKMCADQRTACKKNYSGPTCETEYKICTKSCKK